MAWEIEYTDEFGGWWNDLDEMEPFDPRRTAILLLGGDKTGNDRWYDVQVLIADELYDEHLATLKREGLL